MLCGPGNNGGDGYGAARFLNGCGFEVRVWRCGASEPSGGDTGHEFRLLQAELEPQDAFSAPERLLEALQGHSGLVVDALFGVGLQRPLEAPYADWVAAVNAAPGPCLAVDVPSGLESDTGEALPLAIQADVTATMAAPKLGLVARSALAALGELPRRARSRFEPAELDPERGGPIVHFPQDVLPV